MKHLLQREAEATHTCRRCHNPIWREIPPLPAVFNPREDWRDRYGSICESGEKHLPLNK